MMKRSRLLGFLIVMLLGITAGLIYGWVINPVGVSNTSLDSLRSDYKADYLLMVAESYAADLDIAQAKKALESIMPGDPLRVVQEGLVTAQRLGYTTRELQFMAELEKALTSE